MRALQNGTATLRDPAAAPRLGLALLALVVVGSLGHITEFNPVALLDADNQRNALAFARSFFPPALDAEFLALALRETWRTVAIATAGMALAMLFAVPAALSLTRVLSLSALGRSVAGGDRIPAVVRTALRLLLVSLRSVPELIWALLLVRAVGLGPTAGVLAIAITYAGMLGKVFAEIFESSDPAPAVALLRAGAGRLQGFIFGLLPQCADELISYTVYRWECAIRSSVVLGFVGAGGLGQQMDQSMRAFSGGEVATLMMMFLLLVTLADAISAWLRRVWA